MVTAVVGVFGAETVEAAEDGFALRQGFLIRWGWRMEETIPSCSMEHRSRLTIQPILHLVPSIDGSEVRRLPWQRFVEDWFGRPPAGLAAFRLSCDPERMRFDAQSAVAPPAPASGEQTGAFLAGLWKRDVAEIFLADPDGTYTEWNLSPYGSWWNQRFVAPREADATFSPPVKVIAQVQPASASGWSASLIFPAPPATQLEKLRLNVTMIIGHAIGGNPQYFASVTRPESAPDFHIVNSYPKLVYEKN